MTVVNIYHPNGTVTETLLLPTAERGIAAARCILFAEDGYATIRDTSDGREWLHDFDSGTRLITDKLQTGFEFE